MPPLVIATRDKATGVGSCRRPGDYGMPPSPILAYWLYAYMSNDLVLREAGLRLVTCIVRERQLRLYGHVARLPADDSAHWIFSCRDPSAWTMPRGRPHASWLRHVESYLKNTGMAGLASAWAMARRRRKEYRRKVDAATRCSGVCPHT